MTDKAARHTRWDPLFRHYSAAFLLDCAIIVGFTAMPFFIFNQLGRGAGMSGVLYAVNSLLYAATCLVGAWLTAHSTRPMNWAVLGAALFAVLFCIAPVSRNPYVYGLLTVVGTASVGLVWPALHAWVGSEPDVDLRRRHLARYTVAWSLGLAVGPLFAGPLYDFDYRLPFVLVFILTTLTLFLLRSLPHEADFFAAATPEVLAGRAAHDAASERQLHGAWVANLVVYALLGIARSIFPKRVDELVAAGDLRWWFEEVPSAFLQSGAATKYSWLAFVLSGSTATVFLIMGHTYAWRHRFSLLVAAQIAAAAAFWVLSWTRSLGVMALCCATVGSAAGLCYFAAVYYSLADPAHKLRRSAVFESTVGLGSFGGALSFGLLAERYGVATPFAYTPFLIACALALEFLLIARGPRRPAVDASPGL